MIHSRDFTPIHAISTLNHAISTLNHAISTLIRCDVDGDGSIDKSEFMAAFDAEILGLT